MHAGYIKKCYPNNKEKQSSSFKNGKHKCAKISNNDIIAEYKIQIKTQLRLYVFTQKLSVFWTLLNAINKTLNNEQLNSPNEGCNTKLYSTTKEWFYVFVL